MQLNAVRRGLQPSCPSTSLHYLHGESWKKWCGVPKLDIELLQAMTTYKSYKSSDETINYFWQVIASFDEILQLFKPILLGAVTASADKGRFWKR